MEQSTGAHLAIWAIAASATAGVILRPFRLPEAIWAVLGGTGLVLSGLLGWRAALGAIAHGADVILFLLGMMLLSEVARREGLFDWLAAFAVRHSAGSPARLFLLVYAVGTVVTAFLSNDATAVVLTPAVFAAARAAKADPLPYLYICAFIANAASFVLPISNPANLVLYASRMPPLTVWLERFLLPSALSITTTLIVLYLLERHGLQDRIDPEIEQPPLSAGAATASVGLVATAFILLGASAAGIRLGGPTAIAGIATASIVLIRKRETPWRVLFEISWAILPLVAGLFVLVEGVHETGAIEALARLLHDRASSYPTATAGIAGVTLALLCNAMNNLPAGLIAGSAVAHAHVSSTVTDALLVGVDLGPNLSITGSLATILWLTALRRQGERVGFFTFLGRGALVMPPALVLSLAGLLLAG